MSDKRLRIGVVSCGGMDGGVLFTHSVIFQALRMSEPDVDVFVIDQTWNHNKVDEIIQGCDGIMMPGGEDVNPDMYGEERREKTEEPNFLRDQLDRVVFQSVIKHDVPFLGVCRSIQSANVYFGGTLYQDLKDEYENACEGQFWDWKIISNINHKVTITDGPLADIYGKRELDVNSAHHQGVKDVAKDLKVCAVAEDGLVEGLWLEGPTLFLTVQWHPEDLVWHPDHRLLFDYFTKVCREKAGK